MKEMLSKFAENDPVRFAEDTDDLDVTSWVLDRDFFLQYAQIVFLKQSTVTCTGFRSIRSSKTLVLTALQNKFVIPEWTTFCEYISSIYRECKALTGGKVLQMRGRRG